MAQEFIDSLIGLICSPDQLKEKDTTPEMMATVAFKGIDESCNAYTQMSFSDHTTKLFEWMSSILHRSSSLYGSADAGSELDGSSWSASKCTIRRRYLVALLAFFGFANIYAMRANLSVAIVQMTYDSLKPEFGDWDSFSQGAILGAFFYGYIFTQIPGGYLAHAYGGKLVFVAGVFGTAAFTLITPPLAHMGKGVTYPAMHVMWSHWAPLLEKTKLTSFAFSGSYFGTVFAMPVSALLGYRLGWPFIFYFFVYLKLIPWRQILTSKAVWAIIVAHFCENWGFYMMLTSLPRILEDLMEYQLEKAGFFAALPYLMMGIILVIAGSLADVLRDRYVWSTEKTRKYFCCFGFVGQAIAIMLATTHISANFVMLSIIISIGLGGFPWSAFSVNHLDLAPQYAGHLMGLSNTIATLPGMICPLIVGVIVSEHLEYWASGQSAFTSTFSD
ncbi:unnamed protein product [Anisakis simplex]|uniref:MFS domain-containing protein n=1 Tax=Anisakis simplex TaxID=6269 RepID=A0A0M3JTQ3_ANISI|nr:unnamed protein product [Anisakis simplex]